MESRRLEINVNEAKMRISSEKIGNVKKRRKNSGKSGKRHRVFRRRIKWSIS